MAYISGNAIFAKYFLIPHIPGGDELFPICTAIVGALLAYLWYNSPPAEIYMGDAGVHRLRRRHRHDVRAPEDRTVPAHRGRGLSGRKPCPCVLQIGGFKFTKNLRPDKTGKAASSCGRRCTTTYQLKWKDRFDSGQALNSKIIWRFHLVSILALIIGSLIFFKVR